MMPFEDFQRLASNHVVHEDFLDLSQRARYISDEIPIR